MSRAAAAVAVAAATLLWVAAQVVPHGSGASRRLAGLLLPLICMLLLWRSEAASETAVISRTLEALWRAPKVWVLACVYVVAIWPVGAIIGSLTAPWQRQITQDPSERGLPHAGLWIGVMERLLTISFVLSDAPEAIAVLVAAKGVFRFGEIKDSLTHTASTSTVVPTVGSVETTGADSVTRAKEGTKSRKEAEYILVGSLMSFGAALALGWLARTVVR